MPVELVSMSTATAFDRLRLALIGKQKSGKSQLAATGRPGVLFFDYDQRRESIAGRRNVKAITLTEPPPKPNNVNPCPEAFQFGLDYVAKLEAKRSFTSLGFQLTEGESDHIQTVVVDSMQTCAASAQKYALYNSTDMRREVSIGTSKVYFVKSFDGWNAEMRMVSEMIDRLLAIPNLDVIITLHEAPEEMPESTQEKPKYSGKIDVFPGRYRNLLSKFNEQWRLIRDSVGDPKIQVIPDFAFTAATNLDIGNNPKANLAELITEHLKKHPPLPAILTKVPPQVSGVPQLIAGKLVTK